MLIAADKYALKAPNGIAFSEVRGYETWPVIAPSYRTDKKEVRFIVGNEAMMNAYRQGILETASSSDRR
ncbi:MAG: cytochrome P460 family protein [Comamonadaceae bacterium]|nr:cytochrome P460 family protein [Comamonadaceae bacterium]